MPLRRGSSAAAAAERVGRALRRRSRSGALSPPAARLARSLAPERPRRSRLPPACRATSPPRESGARAQVARPADHGLLDRVAARLHDHGLTGDQRARPWPGAWWSRRSRAPTSDQPLAGVVGVHTRAALAVSARRVELVLVGWLRQPEPTQVCASIGPAHHRRVRVRTPAGTARGRRARRPRPCRPARGPRRRGSARLMVRTRSPRTTRSGRDAGRVNANSSASAILLAAEAADGPPRSAAPRPPWPTGGPCRWRDRRRGCPATSLQHEVHTEKGSPESTTKSASLPGSSVPTRSRRSSTPRR